MDCYNGKLIFLKENQEWSDSNILILLHSKKSLLVGFSQDEQPPRAEEAAVAKQEHHDALPPQPSLSIDNNPSLALLGRNSIEQGLPIPRAMLSHSSDLERGENGGVE